MPKIIKKKSKTVAVKQHPRRVRVSEKNPSGITIVDRHLRHIDGKYLDSNLLKSIFDEYDKKKIDTLKILQDLGGEAKEFVFKDIKKKDLTDPNTSIALGVRWLAHKKLYAEKILKRSATSDEVIQLYKGILKDKSGIASEIMEKFTGKYDKLKK